MERYERLKAVRGALWGWGIASLVLGAIIMAASIPNLSGYGAGGAVFFVFLGAALAALGNILVLIAILVTVSKLMVDAIYDGVDLIIEAVDTKKK